jgi:hypothetical protein
MTTGARTMPRPALRGLPLFALIDPYGGDYPSHSFDLSQCTSFDDLRSIRSDAWEREVYLPEGDAPVTDVYRLPYLVNLEDATDASIDELTEAGLAEHRAVLGGDLSQDYRLGILIETWMAPADLMRRLQQMWTYPRPNTDNLTYLRIGDRRVVEALTHLFEPAVLARWLGPVARWHILGRNMAWITISGEADHNSSWYIGSDFGMRRTVDPARTLENATLRVSAPMHWRLLDHEAVSLALVEWQRAGRAVDADAYQRAWAGARVATEEHRLDAPEDKAAFMFHWMRDPDCATRSPVAEAMRRSKAEERPFAEVLAQIEYRLALSDVAAGQSNKPNPSTS